jgi:23S rRNA G2445 N2-methylase RlmL
VKVIVIEELLYLTVKQVNWENIMKIPEKLFVNIKGKG